MKQNITNDFSLNFNCRDDQTSENLKSVSYSWEVKDPFDSERTRLNLNSFLESINSNLTVVYKQAETAVNVTKSKKS